MAPTRRIEGQHTLPSVRDIEHGLHVRSLSLPMYGVAHESRLLRQSGSFQLVGAEGETRAYTFPPCMQGAECITNRWPTSIPGLTQPFVLMRAMTPEELRTLSATGAAPAGRSPCVLCHREAVCQYVYHLRFLRNNAWLRLENEREVLQLWCNKVDCPDGYFSQCAKLPDTTQYDAILEPVMGMTYSLLRARRSGVQWWIDQPGAAWTEARPLQPHVGENLSLFSSGAGGAR